MNLNKNVIIFVIFLKIYAFCILVSLPNTNKLESVLQKQIQNIKTVDIFISYIKNKNQTVFRYENAIDFLLKTISYKFIYFCDHICKMKETLILFADNLKGLR